MAVFVNDYLLDNGVAALSQADQMVGCAGQPSTFYEAVDPFAWASSTAYALGDVVRPSTRNGFVYEATGAGTSGGTEPVLWPVVAGQTVVDGGVTWTARASKALASVAMAGGDYSLLNGDVSGRKSVSAAKNAVAAHSTGTLDHVAYVDRATKRLLMVDPATVAIAVTGGSSTVNFGAGQMESRDGQAA